jgi:hypothetical protein
MTFDNARDKRLVVRKTISIVRPSASTRAATRRRGTGSSSFVRAMTGSTSSSLMMLAFEPFPRRVTHMRRMFFFCLTT